MNTSISTDYYQCKTRLFVELKKKRSTLKDNHRKDLFEFDRCVIKNYVYKHYELYYIIYIMSI